MAAPKAVGKHTMIAISDQRSIEPCMISPPPSSRAQINPDPIFAGQSCLLITRRAASNIIAIGDLSCSIRKILALILDTRSLRWSKYIKISLLHSSGLEHRSCLGIHTVVTVDDPHSHSLRLKITPGIGTLSSPCRYFWCN